MGNDGQWMTGRDAGMMFVSGRQLFHWIPVLAPVSEQSG